MYIVLYAYVAGLNFNQKSGVSCVRGVSIRQGLNEDRWNFLAGPHGIAWAPLKPTEPTVEVWVGPKFQPQKTRQASESLDPRKLAQRRAEKSRNSFMSMQPRR